jgi:hypothetical protein
MNLAVHTRPTLVEIKAEKHGRMISAARLKETRAPPATVVAECAAPRQGGGMQAFPFYACWRRLFGAPPDADPI